RSGRMDHRDHVALIREGVTDGGTSWADFGSGGGAFTLALADLLGPAGKIYSVDRDRSALARQAQAMRGRFPTTEVHYRQGDFAQPLSVPPLDGIVMANALHFTKDKLPVLRTIFAALRPGGRLVLVEYNTDHGNAWVPYPLTFATWQALAREAGFAETRLVAMRPSRFLGQIFSAVSIRPSMQDESVGVASA
ncbi:MAG TPA: class I SAM-dependent methyltransferase, partial [Chloroflexota bacterium]|nr:class I SAM-dependent methyltransferase [Chloroflexota bacterium]